MRMRSALLPLLAAVALAGCNDPTKGQELFQADLTGGGEVPPRAASGNGTVGFRVDGNSVFYSIEVEGLTGIVGAHIHSAAAGASGPIRVALYPRVGVNASSTPSGTVHGVLVEGVFTSADVTGVTFDELLAEMRAGTAYANVHTTTFPGGEIRGQIRSLGTD